MLKDQQALLYTSPGIMAFCVSSSKFMSLFSCEPNTARQVQLDALLRVQAQTSMCTITTPHTHACTHVLRALRPAPASAHVRTPLHPTCAPNHTHSHLHPHTSMLTRTDAPTHSQTHAHMCAHKTHISPHGLLPGVRYMLGRKAPGNKREPTCRLSKERFRRRWSTAMPMVAANLAGMPASYVF